MVTMVALIALIVVVVALLLAAWGLRRRSAEDVHSVEGYRHALDTLDDMRRGARTSVRVLPLRSDAPEDESEADRQGASEGATGPTEPVWGPQGPSQEADEPAVRGPEPVHREPVPPDPIPWESLQPGREYDEPFLARPAHASPTEAELGPEGPHAGPEPVRARHEMATPPSVPLREPTRASIVRIPGSPPAGEGERIEPQGDWGTPAEGPIKVGPGGGGHESGVGFHPPGPESNNGGSRLVFDDMRGGRPGGPPPGDQDLVPPSRRDRAVARMNHRPRRPIIPIAAVVVALIAVVAVIVYAVTSSGSPSGTQHASSTQHPATTQSPSTTAHSGAGAHTHTSGTPRSTTTTVPKSLGAASATPAAATYSVPGPTYTVTLTVTTGECWVQATSQASGSALFTGLVTPGSAQVLHASGVTLLDIGAPHSLEVSVNGVPATYPAGFLTPFNMTLQPTA